MTTKKYAIAATAAVIALALSACSGGAGADAAPADRDAPGPLDEIFAQIYGWDLTGNQEDRWREEAARQEREVQELIAGCMAEHGFDYIPVITGGWTGEDPGAVPDNPFSEEWGTREFAEKYGFGISTDPNAMAIGRPMPLPMTQGAADATATSDWVDPNQAQLDAMSEAERAAWDIALWGEPQVWDPDDESTWEWSLEDMGCGGRAQAAVWGDGSPRFPEFQALEDEANSVLWQVQDDQRVQDSEAAVRQCMVRAGFDESAANTIHFEWNALLSGGDLGFDPDWDWEANPEGPPAHVPDPAEVEAFREREIAVAVANWDCRTEAQVDRIWSQVNHELQQQFVDRNRAELDAWLAAAAQTN